MYIHVSIGTDQFDARGCIEDYTRVSRAFIIASPTLCMTPPLMSDVADADCHLRVNRRIVRNTVAANYIGLCAITLPVGRDRAGMPVGLQLTAPANVEERLLAIALAAARVLGTAVDRFGTPPLLAREITARAACTRDAGCRAP